MACESTGSRGCSVIDTDELWEDWAGSGKDMAGVWFTSLSSDTSLGSARWLSKHLSNKWKNHFVIEIFIYP